VAVRSKGWNVFSRSSTEIVLFCVGRGLVSDWSPPSKESYRLSTRFTVSELMLNENRPESLIRQGKRRRREEKKNKSIFQSTVHSTCSEYILLLCWRCVNVHHNRRSEWLLAATSNWAPEDSQCQGRFLMSVAVTSVRLITSSLFRTPFKRPPK
jgi:hypothetical protein